MTRRHDLPDWAGQDGGMDKGQARILGKREWDQVDPARGVGHVFVIRPSAA
jgi:hypothetical protein